MSFYESRTVSVKPVGDQSVLEQLKKTLPLLVQYNENSFELKVNGQPAKEESIKSISDKDIVDFSFEYYTADAKKEFDHLLEIIDQTESIAAIVAYDSDYGSYIESYGAVKKTRVGIDDSRWCTGAMPSIAVTFPAASVCELLSCELMDVEDTLDEFDEEELISKVFGESAEELEIEYAMSNQDDESVLLTFNAYFLRGGSIDEMKEQLELYKKAAEYAKSKGGIALFGQEDMLLDPENGNANHTWISENGFKELTLDTVDGKLGEFVEHEYSFQ